jgi:putative GTP pyrophosphokinase
MIRQPIPSLTKHELEEQYHRSERSMEHILFELQRRIRDGLKRKSLRAMVKYRLKDFSSFYEKLQRRMTEADPSQEYIEITDLLGLRIICPFLEDIDEVDNFISAEFEIKEREQKGAEFSFQEFGYQSVHILIDIPQDLRESFHISTNIVAEIQIRTILQDAWAEVEHELVYKSEFSSFDPQIRRKLAALNANLSLSDMIFHEIRLYQREVTRQIQYRRESFISLVRHERNPVSNGTYPEDKILSNSSKGSKKTKASKSKTQSNEASKKTPSKSMVDKENGANQKDRPSHAMSSGIGINQHTFHYSGNEGALLEALIEHNRGNYHTAISIYTELFTDPGMKVKENMRMVLHVHRGMAYYTLENYTAALADFTAVLDEEPMNIKARYYRSLVYLHQNKLKDSLKDLDFCIKQQPYMYDALLSRAKLNQILGNTKTALSDVEKALEIEPDSLEAELLRGQLKDH